MRENSRESRAIHILQNLPYQSSLSREEDWNILWVNSDSQVIDLSGPDLVELLLKFEEERNKFLGEVSENIR